MNLNLHVKKEYFDQIASGVKQEEYRLMTPYWQKRLENRQYDNVVVLCGYPARNDATRRIVYAWQGYTCKTITHPHFGTNPVMVYAIRLGV